MACFDEKELETTHVLLRYFDEHPHAHVLCHMDDGSVFEAELDTAFESDNESMDDGEPYYEFLAIGLHILKTLVDGPAGYRDGEYIEVWYRNFPVKVAASDGEVIYEREGREGR